VHVTPHAPQLASWVDVSTQPPLQEVVGGVQAAWQTPRLQTEPAQTLPQKPQCIGSASGTTQLPAQSSWSPRQSHRPDAQLVPPLQTPLHAPQ
jgi:hypothetical protein